MLCDDDPELGAPRNEAQARPSAAAKPYGTNARSIPTPRRPVAARPP